MLMNLLIGNLSSFQTSCIENTSFIVRISKVLLLHFEDFFRKELLHFTKFINTFFRIHLRHIKLKISVNPEFESKVDVPNRTFEWTRFQTCFFKLFNNDDKKCNQILQ